MEELGTCGALQKGADSVRTWNSFEFSRWLKNGSVEKFKWQVYQETDQEIDQETDQENNCFFFSVSVFWRGLEMISDKEKILCFLIPAQSGDALIA